MANATARKFGYPLSVVAETARWVVQVRPQQCTLGSLVLVSKEPALAFGELSSEAFSDLHGLVRRLEAALAAFVKFERINYLMLMMVDRDVHFHIFPRYEGVRSHDGVEFKDVAWPGPSDLRHFVQLDSHAMSSMVRALAEAWSAAPTI